jgi:PleD family two-component response regulator
MRSFLSFCCEFELLAEIEADHCIDALITRAELKHISDVGLCGETRLLVTCRRPIYVLMMSTQYDQRGLIEALDSGIDNFIGKPPLAEELTPGSAPSASTAPRRSDQFTPRSFPWRAFSDAPRAGA